jgi:hypothetical protein
MRFTAALNECDIPGSAVRTLFAFFSTGAGRGNASKLDSYAILKYGIAGSNFRQIWLVLLFLTCFSK